MGLSLENFPPDLARHGSVVTVGNFDGCHRGHRVLVARAVEEAKSKGLQPVVVTFSPHPEIFFGRLQETDRLFNDAQKIRSFGELGISNILIQPFDSGFAERTAEWFLEEGLVRLVGARAIVVGGNFRFGSGRRGDVTFMRNFLRPFGVEVVLCDLADEDGEVISSSRIRRLLAEGCVELAAKKLGYAYTLEGVVVEGRKLGRTIGFPTANVGKLEQMLPKNGVYAVAVEAGSGDSQSGRQGGMLSSECLPLSGVCNIGVRPTVDDQGSLTVEVHVFDMKGRENPPTEPWYGQPIRIQFLKRIRDEQKFDSLQALKAQISIDISSARDFMRKE